MAYWRQGLCILAGWTLVASPVAAASRADRAWTAAQAAFHDQLWARAETDLATFIHKYPDSPHLAEAEVLEAQAQFQQHKFADALALLTAAKPGAGAMADQFDYWVGEIQAASGDAVGAANTWLTLVGNYPASALRLRSTVEAAAALAGEAQWSRVSALLMPPDGVFQRAASGANGGATDLVTRGWLLLAEAQVEQSDFRGAAQSLGRVPVSALPAGLDWRRSWLAARVKLGQGDPAAALEQAGQALQLAAADATGGEAAASRAVLAAALEQAGRADEAFGTWQQNLTNTIPAAAQQEAVTHLAGVARARGVWTNAEVVLGNFLTTATDPATANFTAQTLGELQLRDYVAGPGNTNLLLAAQAQFARVLTQTNSPWLGRAWLGQGWCDWLQQQWPAAASDFGQAVQALAPGGPSRELAVAQFKMADAQFALGRYAAARDAYRAVLATVADSAALDDGLGDRAWYQILRADLKLPDWADAQHVLRQFLAVYPHSTLVDNGLLLAGEEFSDFGRPAEARATLQACLTNFPASPLRPQVELAVARSYETEHRWAEALAAYTQWERTYPTNDLLPEAEYARGRVTWLSGDETNALALFSGLVARFPAHELAPQAQWWVADYYFRSTRQAGAENYLAAETNYENLFQNTNAAWVASPLVYPAQLMAGRAAMGRLGYSDACGYFNHLLADTNCPLEVALPARFAYAAALMQTPAADTNAPLANFQLATNLYGQVIRLCPTNDTGARAWVELGNCAVQLGDLAAATNAYTLAMSRTATVSVRNQAEVGLGLAFEHFAEQTAGAVATAWRQQALDHYYTVFSGEDNDPFWRKEAGLRALQLLPLLGLPPATTAKVIDHLETVFPQLKPDLEKKKAALNP